MKFPPTEEFAQVVEPWMVQGHPTQPTLDPLWHDWSPATTLDHAQGRFDQATFRFATASGPLPAEVAHENTSDALTPPAVERCHRVVEEEEAHGNTSDKVPSPTANRLYRCWMPDCEKTYVRSGDLGRHVETFHENPASFLCHFRRCPRSIKGRGFPRRDKLVDHLKSRKHDLSHEDAVYEAALHNPPRYRWMATRLHLKALNILQ
jgi:hypothetical protein